MIVIDIALTMKIEMTKNPRRTTKKQPVEIDFEIDTKIISIVESLTGSSYNELVKSVPKKLWDDPSRGSWLEKHIHRLANDNGKAKKKKKT